MKRLVVVIESEGDDPADYWQDFQDGLNSMAQDFDEDALEGEDTSGIAWAYKIEEVTS